MAPNASCIVLSGSSIRLQLRPYRSLDRRGVRGFLIFVCLVCFAGATAAAFQGAWPALVFAAVEAGAVGAALRVNMRAREDLHELLIDDRNVRLQITERGRTTGVTLPRYWARVRLLPSPFLFHPKMLRLECQGRTCEFGSFLTEIDRAALAKILVPVIGPCGCAPSLPDALDHITRAALPSPFRTEQA